MKKFKIITFICIILCVAAGIAAAADAKFEVSLDRERLALGETAQLGLSFHGTQSMPAPDIGSIDGLEIRYIGPSTMMTVINGNVSSSITHMYSVQPLRVGKFQIGPFSFKYKNDNYTSNMVLLNVTEERALNQRPQAQAPAAEPITEKMNLEDRMFVTLNLDKPTAYVNELIPVTVKLYVNRMNVSDIQLPAFSQEGFSKVEFKEPKQYRENMNGLTYDVLEFRTNLYSTRPGDYKVGPARIKCNIVVRKKMAGGMPDDMFGNDPALRDSFFDDFLARYEKQPAELKSDEAHLIVSPLPIEGRPKDFTGAVGDYQFIYEASPTKVKTGDPITLRMTINGTGNFNTVLSPQLDVIEGFNAYEPEVKTQENSKVFTQVLIPGTEKITQVPKATFSYFDPIASQYKSITQGPIAVQVEKSKEELPSKVVEPVSAASKASEKELAGDIIYIKEAPGKWLPKENPIYKNAVFWLLVVIPLLAFISIYIVVGRMNRIRQDFAYASRLASLKVAKTGMKALKRELKLADSTIFYEALFKTMQSYLGNRLHMPPSGLTFDMVNHKLLSEDVETAVITKIRNLFIVCDTVRFAFIKFNDEKMNDDYKELEDIIKYLERRRL